ncbi:MAG TPA: xanthine dehydrogenase family protein subunit M [Nitrososphaerales archaeon]|nr:xanthine dehydrogenase family protein subunit M [Nitrososphaerales archaeon]
MIPKKFDYYAPGSLQEAIKLLRQNAEAKILAGGQSLLPLMKLRLAAPTSLVDISKLPDLSYVRDEDDHLAIGPLVTHDTIEHDGTIKDRFTLINDAVARIGDKQVRNLGTIGGSVCHADPAADIPTALLAADARFVIEGEGGRRVVPARDFFVDFFSTAVGHDEILTELQIPHLPRRSGSAYIKHSLREADFAIANVGTIVAMEEDGKTCGEARIGLGSAGPTPLRAASAEQYLKGRPLDETTIAEASERAIEGANPPSDVHGSREYRLKMIKVLTQRSLRLALGRTRMTSGETER